MDGQLGWWVDQGSAEVVPGIGLESTTGLKILPDDPFTQARLTLYREPEPSDGDQILYFDAWVRMPAAPWLVFDETFDLDGARIGLFRSSAQYPDPEWHVFDGDGVGGGIWYSTGLQVATDPFTDVAVDWARLTVRQDIASGTWDLWVDGELIAYDLGFQVLPEPGVARFYVLGDFTRPVYLDNIGVSAENPLGQDVTGTSGPPEEFNPEDSDGDGIPDRWELQYGLNPADALDGEADNDADGLSNAAEFLQGTNPLSALSRHPRVLTPVLDLFTTLRCPAPEAE